MKNEITILCKINGHGSFTQIAGDHVRLGRGTKCPKCSGKEWTYKDIIEKCKLKHNNYYDYSKTKFIIQDSLVTITCPEHGDFIQNLLAHKNGSRCKKCAGFDLTKEEAIEKCKKIHGNKYDYSDMEYENMSTYTNVRCKKHGIFYVRLTDHCSSKRGCGKCSGYYNYNLNDFKEISEKVHQKYYKYENAVYTKALDKVCITCPKHGNFYQEARAHMNGFGCRLCAKKGISKKQLEWLDCLNIASDGTIQHYGNGGEHLIEGSLYRVDGYCSKTNTVFEFHGDYFHGNPEIYHPDSINTVNGKTMGNLYKETQKREEYIKSLGYNLKVVWEFEWLCALQSIRFLQRKWKGNTDIKIKKPKHGVWTIEKFLEKAKIAHPDIEYDYSKVKFVNRYDTIEIGCPEHGYFTQVVHNHLAKRGCPMCGIKKSADAHKSNTKTFTKNAGKIHKNKYDYSKVDYIDENTPVTIICPIHGEFTQKPVHHLKKNGCQKCGYDSVKKKLSLGKEKFIEKAKAKFGDLYDYSLVDYINTDTPVTIICQKHGEFRIRPYLHTRVLKGKNTGYCQKCSYEMAVAKRKIKVI